MHLPRRERHILEYLMSNKGRRVTEDFKSSISFTDSSPTRSMKTSSSHINKLRKRLRHRLEPRSDRFCNATWVTG